MCNGGRRLIGFVFFVADVGHRLCQAVGFEEGAQRQVPRKVPAHSADAEQIEKVRPSTSYFSSSSSLALYCELLWDS